MRCPNCDWDPMEETEITDFSGKPQAVLYICPRCRSSERREL